MNFIYTCMCIANPVSACCLFYFSMLMMICLPPQGTSPPTQQATRPTVHTAHSQHCGHTALPLGKKTKSRRRADPIQSVYAHVFRKPNTPRNFVFRNMPFAEAVARCSGAKQNAKQNPANDGKQNSAAKQDSAGDVNSSLPPLLAKGERYYLRSVGLDPRCAFILDCRIYVYIYVYVCMYVYKYIFTYIYI